MRSHKPLRVVMMLAILREPLLTVFKGSVVFLEATSRRPNGTPEVTTISRAVLNLFLMAFIHHHLIESGNVITPP